MRGKTQRQFDISLPFVFLLHDAHDVAGENLQSTTMTSTTSTSLGSSEITETVSSSMNTEEVSATDFMDALQHGAIVAVTPMELALSAQLGYRWLHFSFVWFMRNNISQVKWNFFLIDVKTREKFFLNLDI